MGMNVASISTVADQVWYLLEQGGWVMLAIFLLGQVGWFLVMERWWSYRQQTHAVLDLLDADQTVGSTPEAMAALEKRLMNDGRVRGMFVEIVRGLAAVRHQGEEAMVRRTREILTRGSHRIHKHLGTIAAVSSAAPMLGLAGTVGGVMVTFEVITVYGIGNPAMMAGGIAEALMVTEAALVVALPLMVLHDRLATRADKIESECVAGATRLIRAFAPGESGESPTTLPLAIDHGEGETGNYGSVVRV